ncbi:TPA: conjugation system SOS inhibitor PsiB [Klebsiella aerogenes]|nr:conjugation system SOS inhibitor PsiB [Klebsiella aerogenes]
MQSILTAQDLSRFIPSDFEDYRAGGADLRRELIHAVMHDLTVPERWHINGEYGSEFGGLFPVQCRFSPAHERFYVALCSPGDINPGWLMVFVDGNGTPAVVPDRAEGFRLVPERTGGCVLPGGHPGAAERGGAVLWPR